MFTLDADDLSAIIDKVAWHCPERPGLDVILLDCTPTFLHAVAGGGRTLAVARTRVSEGRRWTAPLSRPDAAALSWWLDAAEHVSVEHALAGGRALLRFAEGAAQLTVPIATQAPILPWRKLLRSAAQEQGDGENRSGGPLSLTRDELALWAHAGDRIAFSPPLRNGPVLVRAGADFIGLHMPGTPRPFLPARTEGWKDSARSWRFVYAGEVYEMGRLYWDEAGTPWRVLAAPEPGEEPTLVLANGSGVALPLSTVQLAGGRPRSRRPDHRKK
ncbi:hypothetical protein K7472_08135 [Streptomyces sp. PTM05]|uniref:Uncharacterized protein n=1 Tax=Streptantibioticus parmotrematis TaxID=2873249 RepID=A0ABS7QNR3_9ACTN|nr:hypothetical protein [Streptantibioticus parmotrematis]MBY8884814.1 hypothetical protein [Streptantibioticus parmotrematis]